MLIERNKGLKIVFNYNNKTEIRIFYVKGFGRKQKRHLLQIDKIRLINNKLRKEYDILYYHGFFAKEMNYETKRLRKEDW